MSNKKARQSRNGTRARGPTVAELAIRERGILMHARSVAGILAGVKHQTRRIIKPQPPEWMTRKVPFHVSGDLWAFGVNHRTVEVAQSDNLLRCPYGQPGDQLWVRETHMLCEATLDSLCAKNGESRIVTHDGTPVEVFYRASAGRRTRFLLEAGSDLKWRPSLFMHRWASRITLEITDVRVQRVEEISEGDARAEGVNEEADKDGRPVFSAGGEEWFDTAREAFLHLFYEINERAPRDSNPWVWVIEFQRMEVSHG